MDIVIGKYSFNAKTLRSLSKTKAIENFSNFDKSIIERAWHEANPKKAKKKMPKNNK